MNYDLIFDRVFRDLRSRYPHLAGIENDLKRACACMIESYRGDGRMYICGNGGSAADAEHIIGELMQPYKLDRPVPAPYRAELERLYPDMADYYTKHLKGALPCFSLAALTGFCTAYINDHAADMVYAQQIYGMGRKGDVLLGITTSGSSRNVINAIRIAHSIGMKTVLLTSEKSVVPPCDGCISIRAPGTECCPVQELHLPIYHAICEILELAFFSAD